MKNIAKNVLQIVTGFGAAITLCAGKVMSAMATTSVEEGAAAARGEGMPSELIGNNGVINHFTNIVLYIVGFIAVIMLIWGGVRYIVSGGDSKKITDAKNTILYALLGLIIAFFAYAIVNFILGAITPAATEDPETTSLILNTISRLV